MKTTTFNVIETFNENLVKAILNAGDRWECPWISKGSPKNLKTGLAYSGINWLYLLFTDYKSEYFLTFNQVREMGGKVKKGAKAEMIIFSDYIFKHKETRKILKREELASIPADEIETSSFIKYYNIFSLDYIEGIETPEKNHQVLSRDEINKNCEAIINGFKDRPLMSEDPGLLGACYFPDFDAISYPSKERFKSLGMFYSTLFHELAHSTGHDSRLRRKSLYSHEFSGDEKKKQYAFEELVAEITGMFLIMHSGLAAIEELSNSMTYLKSWVTRFDHKDKTLIQAAMKANTAFHYILGHENSVQR